MIKENPGEFFSIKESRRAKLLVKGSKFIASAIPISSEGEAKLSLEKIIKEFYDATHNPFAYVLSEKESKKFSDDREPPGTAGMRILSAIESQSLKDTLVVVTRYFGGTKLGTGGLAKAYYESALRVLRSCVIIKKENRGRLSLFFPKGRLDQVQKVLNQEKVEVERFTFGDRIKMEINFREATYSRLRERLKNCTRGEIEFEEV